jgi:hypothetical protein
MFPVDPLAARATGEVSRLRRAIRRGVLNAASWEAPGLPLSHFEIRLFEHSTTSVYICSVTSIQFE